MKVKVEDWTILFFNLKREHGSKYYWELIKGGVTSESDESGETRGWAFQLLEYQMVRVVGQI